MARGPLLDAEQVLAAHARGDTPAEIARAAGAQPPAVTRLLKRFGVTLHPRRSKARFQVVSPLGEAELRELARQIDRIWYAPTAAPPLELDRRPCRRCEVRGDVHRLHGCNQWL